MTIATEIERILRETIKVDASGLAPAVVAHHITGFEEAARRIAYESAKQKEAEAWREDVAEMPDEGERFLAEDEHGDWITVRRFDPRKPKDYSANAVINGRTGRWWYPRRWRPLPEPPSALLSAGGENG